MSSDLRHQLAKIQPSVEHWLLFDNQGSLCPPLNHLSVGETFSKFIRDFLPLCPILDPRGHHVKIRKENFPKLLNLSVLPGYPKRRPSTIVQLLESGSFDESEYEWQRDRIQALFWIPNVITNPSAIYRMNRSHGVIPAREVYVKVYNRMGSTVKLVFVDQVGKNSDRIVITSFLTSPKTAKKYCDGMPLYWNR